MQTFSSQRSGGFWRGLWQALISLQFITSFFGWFFMLLSRLAEPLMSLSAIYIIICAGIPAWKVPGVYDAGVAIMIAAPEIILPGAFVLAGQYSERGDTRSRMLYGVAWLFVALTFFTLADLFIFHLEGGALNALMWGRCAVGISYSILLRVLTHDGHPQPAQQTTVSASVLDYQEIARHLKALFPQPAPAPQIDYQELAQQLVPLMPAPQVDYQAITEQLEATFKATMIREITAIRTPLAGTEPGTGERLRPRSQSHLLALEPPARATSQSHLLAPAPLTGAAPRSHVSVPEPLTSATHQSHVTEPVSGARATSERLAEPGAGAIEERLQRAYQELSAEGRRVSGRALAARARCHRSTATEWLQGHMAGAEMEPEPPAEAMTQSQTEPVEASA